MRKVFSRLRGLYHRHLFRFTEESRSSRRMSSLWWRSGDLKDFILTIYMATSIRASFRDWYSWWAPLNRLPAITVGFYAVWVPWIESHQEVWGWYILSLSGAASNNSLKDRFRNSKNSFYTATKKSRLCLVSCGVRPDKLGHVDFVILTKDWKLASIVGIFSILNVFVVDTTTSC